MRVLVFGNGVSGRGAMSLLVERGYDAFSLSDEVLKNSEKDFDENYFLSLFEDLEFIVVSPGIDLKSRIICFAKKCKIKIVGELELGYKFLKGDIIAITGTNGKTTTVSLINYILSSSGKNVFLGGNIGTAVSSFANLTKCGDISVLECSSFQLETVIDFKPHISAILNLSEDHLSRHGTMENYISAKQNISKNQESTDFLLINADCELLMKNLPKTRAKIMFFSTKKKVFGCYVKNNCIYFNDNQREKKLVSLDGIKLLGEHNLSNIVCSVFAVYLETKRIDILKKITEFEGVAHRIEFVQKINGISFFNDSKATNIDSTIVSTRCFNSGINLILGGSDKGYSFDNLFKQLPKNVKNIAVFGQTKQKILFSAKKYNYSNIFSFETLKDCTYFCFKSSNFGDIVLLSPACASFDFFSNYEERGNVFKKIVKELSYENPCIESKA